MPYTHVTRTTNGAAAIQYIYGDGRGHNGAKVRNEIITGVGMLPASVMPFAEQMDQVWRRMPRNHKTQIDRYIMSFSRKELDPTNPNDLIKASMIGREFAKEIAPGHQAVVAVQHDGKGGKVHVHIAVNDARTADTRGLPATAYWFWTFKEKANEICKQFFSLDFGADADDKKSQYEREALGGKYSWKKDLKERIGGAAIFAKNDEEFLAGLEEVGVKATRRHATKTQPEYYVYELTDYSHFPADKMPKRACLAKSYKLGAEFNPDKIREQYGTYMDYFPDDLVAQLSEAIQEPTPEPEAEIPKPKQKRKVTDRAKRNAWERTVSVVGQIVWPLAGLNLATPLIKNKNGEDVLDKAEIARREQMVQDVWDPFIAWLDARGESIEDYYIIEDEDHVYPRRVKLQKKLSEWMEQPEEQPVAEKASSDKKPVAPKVTKKQSAQELRQRNADRLAVLEREYNHLMAEQQNDASKGPYGT